MLYYATPEHIKIIIKTFYDISLRPSDNENNSLRCFSK